MAMSSSLQAVLSRVVSGRIMWDEPLSGWTTLRVGGPADALVILLDSEELQALLGVCHQENIAWKLLGRGSNILASDQGFRGIIIVLGEGFKYISAHQHEDGERCLVRAGAAVGLPRLADWCGDQGLSGMEFASGIPGTVGGAVAMNAGAWGREMADVVEAIELTDQWQVLEVAGEELSFGYRSCDNLAGERKYRVVSGVRLLLKTADREQIRATMHNLLQKRRERQPLKVASGGSVFKNPAGESAGRLIEAAGLKGLRVGDAEVSEQHANFIVNLGSATAEDICTLIAKVQHRVKQQSGIELVPELEMI